MIRMILAAALVAWALPVGAQTANNLSAQQFVNKAAVSNMFELRSSRLALKRSKDKQVQQFAHMIINDHTKAGKELKSLAQKLQGIKVPARLDSEHRQMLSKLRSEKGAAFNNTYRMQQTNGHEQAVQMFQQYASNGDNAQLKAWAQQTLPVLQKHLEQVKALPQFQAPTVGTGSSPSAPRQPNGNMEK